MLGLSMLEPGITALKTIEKLALDFLKEAAPHPPGPQIYKTSPPAMPGTKHEQQPNSGIRSQKTNQPTNKKPTKCQRAFTLTCPSLSL